MTDHPITPPPELVHHWAEARLGKITAASECQLHIATQAARWGADQELKACCEWLRKDDDAYQLVGLRAVYLDHDLRAARRPKPPSLKQQALEALDSFEGFTGSLKEVDTIRRALEQLDG